MRVFTRSRDSIRRRASPKPLIWKWTESREKVHLDIILPVPGTDKDVIGLGPKTVKT